MNVGYAHGSLEDERELCCPECGSNIFVDKVGLTFRCMDQMCTLSSFDKVKRNSDFPNVASMLEKIHGITRKMYDEYHANNDVEETDLDRMVKEGISKLNNDGGNQ